MTLELWKPVFPSFCKEGGGIFFIKNSQVWLYGKFYIYFQRNSMFLSREVYACHLFSGTYSLALSFLLLMNYGSYAHAAFFFLLIKVSCANSF